MKKQEVVEGSSTKYVVIYEGATFSYYHHEYLSKKGSTKMVYQKTYLITKNFKIQSQIFNRNVVHVTMG